MYPATNTEINKGVVKLLFNHFSRVFSFADLNLN